MRTSILPGPARTLMLVAAVAILAGCADRAPVAPEAMPADAASLSLVSEPAQLATLRRASARYHNLSAALDDGFVFLTGCEVREEGSVGIMYVHPGWLGDGRADPSQPDALIYEPRAGGRPRLVAVELAIGYDKWTSSEPPTFLGAEFEREDEFQVYGLHVWLWRDNPNGLFAETNPNVSC